MKKKILSIIIIFLAVIPILNTKEYDVITKRKNYLEGNEQVSHKELALASALSYMPLPASCKLVKNKLNKPCYFSDREIVVDKINQYINLHNYATSKELDGWQLVDYTAQKTAKVTTGLDRLFNAYTLKKGNNIIILFRGTDFADITEWIQHLSYATSSVHKQEAYAEKYVLQQAKKYKDCNIYITGHSLGGYLTEIAASTLTKAIENGKNNSTDWDGWNLNKVYNINDLLDSNGTFNDYKDINFVQAVGFNGMGLLFNAKTTDEVTKQDKKIEVLKNIGTNEYGESKLINYNVKGDVVSSLGLQFGEIREIKAALDSVTYHRKNYKFLNKGNELLTKILAPNNSSSQLYKFSNSVNKTISLDNYLRSDVVANYNYYNTKSIVAYLNLTHESDEFACLLNGNENAKVNIYEEMEWFHNSHLDYITKKQKDTILYNKDDTLKIRAMTTGACARKYVWYECDDKEGNNCREVQTNSLDNENNSSTLETNINNEIKYYKVKAIYNDTYTTKKLENVDGKYKYVNENENVKHIEKEIESKVITVIKDTEKPNCTVNEEAFSNKLGCAKNIELTCSDNVGIQKEKINTLNFSGNLKSKVSISTNDSKRNDITPNMKATITLKSKSITVGNQKLNISIKDYAGNKANVSVSGKINLFGKCN